MTPGLEPDRGKQGGGKCEEWCTHQELNLEPSDP